MVASERLETHLRLKQLHRPSGGRWITARATTPTPDRAGDVVLPEGVRFELPMPLLFMHRHGEPVGVVRSAKTDAAGITIKAEIVEGARQADEVWTLVEAGALGAVSIGFRPLESEPLESGGLKFTRWEWLETSIVSIPANRDARISAIGKCWASPASELEHDARVSTSSDHWTDRLADEVADAILRERRRFEGEISKLWTALGRQ